MKLVLHHPRTDVVLEDTMIAGDTRWRARLKGRSSGGYDTGFGATAQDALSDLRKVYALRLEDVDAAIAELPNQIGRRGRR